MTRGVSISNLGPTHPQHPSSRGASTLTKVVGSTLTGVRLVVVLLGKGAFWSAPFLFSFLLISRRSARAWQSKRGAQKGREVADRENREISCYCQLPTHREIPSDVLFFVVACMQEDEFEDLLGVDTTQDALLLGTPCRLVGRFAPVQGSFTVDCAAVTFHSSPRLRQLSVNLSIPTRSILACTTEGCAVSLAIQGMAGRGISFEFDSAAQCCKAALSLATAGQMSEEELDAGTEEDADLGGCSAVLDEVVLCSRFSFALSDGCRLLAWERCTCLPVAHSSPAPSHCAANAPDINDVHEPGHKGAPAAERSETVVTDSNHITAVRPVGGILYVCEGGLIFLPDRYCKCSGESTLRAVSTILPKPECQAVRQILGGVQVQGCWLGRRPCAHARTGWAAPDARMVQRPEMYELAPVTLCFLVGLSKDFEALSHAAHALLEVCMPVRCPGKDVSLHVR